MRWLLHMVDVCTAYILNMTFYFLLQSFYSVFLWYLRWACCRKWTRSPSTSSSSSRSMSSVATVRAHWDYSSIITCDFKKYLCICLISMDSLHAAVIVSATMSVVSAVFTLCRSSLCVVLLYGLCYAGISVSARLVRVYHYRCTHS